MYFSRAELSLPGLLPKCHLKSLEALCLCSQGLGAEFEHGHNLFHLPVTPQAASHE